MHGVEALPLVDVTTPVIAAISELSAKGFGIVGVTEGGALKGVITDGDVRRYLERNASATMQGALHETRAGAIMTEGSVTMRPGHGRGRGVVDHAGAADLGGFRCGRSDAGGVGHAAEAAQSRNGLRACRR